VFDGWLKERRDSRIRAKKAGEFREALALRLRSLDENERLWIKYCLFHNTQMLSAQMGNRTAQSLDHKGIVEQGAGHMLDLPFHIPDQVWRYLLEYRDEFLPEDERSDRRFVATLDSFRQSLWADY